MEGDGYMVKLYLSTLHPILRHDGVRASNFLPPPSLLLLINARFINNKNLMLQAYIATQNVEQACVTETWPREGKLSDLASPGYLVLHQSRTEEQGGVG